MTVLDVDGLLRDVEGLRARVERLERPPTINFAAPPVTWATPRTGAVMTMTPEDWRKRYERALADARAQRDEAIEARDAARAELREVYAVLGRGTVERMAADDV